MGAVTTTPVTDRASPSLTPSVDQPPRTWTTFAMPSSTYTALTNNPASISSSNKNGGDSTAPRADPTVETSQHERTQTSPQSAQGSLLGETQLGSQHRPHHFTAASDALRRSTASRKTATHLTDTEAVVNGATLSLGETMTLGSGSSGTTISLIEHRGSTFVAYGSTSTTPIRQIQGAEPIRHASSLTQSTISQDYRDSWIVNGETFAPGSVITLGGERDPKTFSMLTSIGHTFIAIGTSTTIPFGTKSSANPPLDFTRASNGNFVLSGTTLKPGKPITIGSAGAETTLKVTLLNSTPAILLDGTATDLLGVATLSSDIAPSSATGLPVITQALTPGNTQGMPAGGTRYSSRTSGCEHPSAELVSILLIAVLILAIQAAH